MMERLPNIKIELVRVESCIKNIKKELYDGVNYIILEDPTLYGVIKSEENKQKQIQVVMMDSAAKMPRIPSIVGNITRKTIIKGGFENHPPGKLRLQLNMRIKISR